MTPEQRAEALRLAEALSKITSVYIFCQPNLDAASSLLRTLAAEPQAEPVAWIEGPHGAIRANPLFKWSGPTTINWSIPLYIHSDPKQTHVL